MAAALIVGVAHLPFVSLLDPDRGGGDFGGTLL
jgi:hypothetical protein